MQQLNLPSYPFKIKNENGKPFIFDQLRKKYVALTPEEWVRQHFTSFLISEKGYPASLIANEHPICINGHKRRCDTVVYNNHGHPVVIVEYKAPYVAITQETFNQIALYNIKFKVGYLIVSNGLQHYCCRMNYENMTYEFLPDIPSYTR